MVLTVELPNPNDPLDFFVRFRLSPLANKLYPMVCIAVDLWLLEREKEKIRKKSQIGIKMTINYTN